MPFRYAATDLTVALKLVSYTGCFPLVAGVIVMVVWPWVMPVSVEVRSVRSLRTQQRAQCQMPKTRLCFSMSSYFGLVLGVQRIPLEID